MDSILTHTKKLLGIEEADTNFDTDISTGINSALFSLNQLGVGPSTGFSISDKETKWSDFIGDRIDLEAVKSFVYLKTKLIFDPPQSSYLVDAIKAQISEIEWRLNVQVENSVTS